MICSTCDKTIRGAVFGVIVNERADAQGRCFTCSANDARAVECECAFLYAGEAHSICRLPPRCYRCGAAREVNELAFCAPCVGRAA